MFIDSCPIRAMEKFFTDAAISISRFFCSVGQIICSTIEKIRTVAMRIFSDSLSGSSSVHSSPQLPKIAVGIANAGRTCHFAASLQVLRSLGINGCLGSSPVEKFFKTSLDELEQAQDTLPAEWSIQKLQQAVSLKILEPGVEEVWSRDYDPLDSMRILFETVHQKSPALFERVISGNRRPYKSVFLCVNQLAENPDALSAIFDGTGKEQYWLARTGKISQVFSLVVRSAKKRALKIPSHVTVNQDPGKGGVAYQLKSVLLFHDRIKHYTAAVPRYSQDGNVSGWTIFDDSKVDQISAEKFHELYGEKIDALFYSLKSEHVVT